LANCTCKAVTETAHDSEPSTPWLIVTSLGSTDLCKNTTIYSSATLAGANAVSKAFNNDVGDKAPFPVSVPAHLWVVP
jgi:hypothetical protein